MLLGWLDSVIIVIIVRFYIVYHPSLFRNRAQNCWFSAQGMLGSGFEKSDNFKGAVWPSQPLNRVIIKPTGLYLVTHSE